MTDPRPWAYSAFRVEVSARRLLSPRFLRLTFSGDDLRHFAPWGVDQRIKVVLPMADGTIADFGLLAEPTPHPSDWYARWRALPEGERNVLRTYTPAEIRPERGEIDVDFFLHEPAGPASAWARAAEIGERLVITGPDARNGYTGYGIHWAPGEATRFLLTADETAYPAARNILRSLPPAASVDLFVDALDLADDVLSAAAPSGVRVHVVPRGPHPCDRLQEAVRSWSAASPGLAGDPGFFAWLAGESASVAGVRRLLTREVGVPKERVAFLGYWRQGGPLVD